MPDSTIKIDFSGICIKLLDRSSPMNVLQKKLRKKDPDLLAEVRREKCCIDGCRNPAEAAHIKSRGSGGDDDPKNIVPLCHWHHVGEQHVIGWRRFRERHPEVRTFAEIKEERSRLLLGEIQIDSCRSALEI